jgi:hypothetical protein
MREFEEYPRKKINPEVRKRDPRCTKEAGEYSLGLKV